MCGDVPVLLVLPSSWTGTLLSVGCNVICDLQQGTGCPLVVFVLCNAALDTHSVPGGVVHVGTVPGGESPRAVQLLVRRMLKGNKRRWFFR